MVAVIRRHLPARLTGAQATDADAAAGATTPPAQTGELKTAQEQTGDPAIFNMDSLMRVMGRDSKGRSVMFKMVRGALDTGMQPLIDIDLARAEGRLRDAARLLHGLRGAVGALGAKRLIQATIAAEGAITDQREEFLPALCDTVREELERTLAAARAWLDREDR